MTMLEYKRYKKKSLKGGKREVFFGRRKSNKKKGSRRSGHVKYVFGVIILILSLVACGKLTHSFFTTSPLFMVTDLEVVKDPGLKDFDFEKTPKVKGRESLFTLDLREVAGAFRKNPWVEQVAVRKVYPGKLVVILAKRKPAAMINLDGLYFVDSRGEVFKKVSRYDSKLFPVITGFSKKMMKEDRGKESLLRMISLRDMLTGSIVEGNVSEIHYHRKEGASLVLKDSGLRIKLGTEEIESAFARLERHYDKIKSHRGSAGYVDLKYPGKIIVGQKKSR